MSKGNAVISYVTTDTTPNPQSIWEMLLINTEGEKPLKYYRTSDDVKKDFPSTFEEVTDPETGQPIQKEVFNRTYSQSKSIFEQKAATGNTLVARIQIIGIATPAAPENMIIAIEDIQDEYNDWDVFMSDIETLPFIIACQSWADSTQQTYAQLKAGFEEHPKQHFSRIVLTDENKVDFFESLENETLILDSIRGSLFAVTNKLEEIAGAVYGNLGGHYPYHTTAKFKQLDGITNINLKKHEKDILRDYNINFYAYEYRQKYQFLKEGVTTSGQYIDIVIARDFIAESVRDEVYSTLIQRSKIEFSNDGFSLAGDAVIRGLRRAFEFGMIRANEDGQPDFSIIIPTVEDALRDQKLERRMPLISWTTVASGAVHHIPVQGVVTADDDRSVADYINLGILQEVA